MKRVITILLAIMLCLVFILVASAEETEQNKEQEIKAYIEEKIVPVIIGVATSLIALLGTLKSVLSTLKSLRTSKDDFVTVSKDLKKSNEVDRQALREEYQAIKDAVSDVPELLKVIEAQDELIKRLEQSISVTAEILSLAYSANSELVRTGKAKKMYILLDKLSTDRGTKEVNDGESI